MMAYFLEKSSKSFHSGGSRFLQLFAASGRERMTLLSDHDIPYKPRVCSFALCFFAVNLAERIGSELATHGHQTEDTRKTSRQVQFAAHRRDVDDVRTGPHSADRCKPVGFANHSHGGCRSIGHRRDVGGMGERDTPAEVSQRQDRRCDPAGQRGTKQSRDTMDHELPRGRVYWGWPANPSTYPESSRVPGRLSRRTQYYAW